MYIWLRCCRKLFDRQVEAFLPLCNTLPSQNWCCGLFEIFYFVYILAGSWQKWTWNKDDGVSRVCREDWVQAPPCHCKSEMLYICWTDKLHESHCQGTISLPVNKSKQSYQKTKTWNQINVKVITYRDHFSRLKGEIFIFDFA